MANKAGDVSPGHFGWLVESRSRNQASTAELYRIISDNDRKMTRHPDLQLAAQELTGIAFSLWRAVFLSDTTGELEDQMADVRKFLISLISDNTVLYITNKNARNWSFRYDLDNAYLRLFRLSKGELDLLKGVDLTREADTEKGQWANAQAAFDAALSNFQSVTDAMPSPAPT